MEIIINDTNTANYIPAFDGVRGIACLAVFFVHFQEKAQLQFSFGPFQIDRFFENGNTGVALFFALSGFLLSLPFWQANQIGASVPSLLTYFLKRIARILPAFYLCLTALVIHNELWQDQDKWQDILFHYAFVFNFFETAIFRISQPFWTLAVEMQFYLFLPLLFLFPSLISERWRFILIFGVGIGAYFFYLTVMQDTEQRGAIDLLGQQLSSSSPVLIYTLLAHIPHFMLGIVAGYIYLGLKDDEELHRYQLKCGVIFWLSTITILFILSTPLDDWLQIPYGRYNLPYIPVLIAAILVTLPFCNFAGRLLCLFPIHWIGIISYGVYIFHLPCQNLMARVMSKFGLSVPDWWVLFLGASLLFTIIVSSASYYLVEKPVLNAVKGRKNADHEI